MLGLRRASLTVTNCPVRASRPTWKVLDGLVEGNVSTVVVEDLLRASLTVINCPVRASLPIFVAMIYPHT
ncbi:hypothetical protein [Acinetobacter calcoaceticus]|uniref:hypothetical protein n=1 Tax=Acinetobacter calcoaceticus TaxID=471 RepID=UPI00321B67F2